MVDPSSLLTGIDGLRIRALLLDGFDGRRPWNARFCRSRLDGYHRHAGTLCLRAKPGGRGCPLQHIDPASGWRDGLSPVPSANTGADDGPP